MDDVPYQAEMTPTFHLWRRRLEFLPSETAPIRDLIPQLSFIKDPRRWGMPFRRGLFEIPEEDFLCIANVMKVDWKSGR